MGALLRSITAGVVISLGASAPAQTLDRPIDGQRLVLKKVGAATKLTFVSRDPIFLFPAIGGVDDPAMAGATIELFSESEGQASLTVPAGAGNPGWTAAGPPTPNHRFRNGEAPGGISVVRVAVLREGKTVKVVAKSAGLPLAVSQGAVGIRITTGSLRNCARFTGPTIGRDVPGAFVASNAAWEGVLGSCSDGSMIGQPECGGSFPFCGGACPGDDICGFVSGVCQCVPADGPCGDTSPACGGTCPAGEQCFSVGGGPLPGCVCLPTGSTPCGTPGMPVCGGACPSGTACEPFYGHPFYNPGGCACAAPEDCGAGGLDCPNGFACATYPPPAGCVPISCGGDYPTCGGACGSGGTCQPFRVEFESSTQVITECLCAVAAPCDLACGGYTCPSGDVCTAQIDESLSSTCSCGAP